MNPALVAERPEEEGTTDFVLKHDSAWVTVKGFSVYLKQTDEGVAVDIYPKGEEDGEAIASTYAFDSEVENVRADKSSSD